jgi:amphi-Trp domain-containing protein
MTTQRGEERVEEMAKKQSVEFRRTMETSQLISYLEALADSLKSGRVVLEQADRFVSLAPPSFLEVEVSATQKEDKAKFSMEFSWKRTTEKTGEEELRISSSEPISATLNVPTEEE